MELKHSWNIASNPELGYFNENIPGVCNACKTTKILEMHWMLNFDKTEKLLKFQANS